LNHQSPLLRRRIGFHLAHGAAEVFAWMLSSTSAVPPGASIIAAATSHEAMIEYCGLVEVCIRYASLKR
jgi:hypothetical protein